MKSTGLGRWVIGGLAVLAAAAVAAAAPAVRGPAAVDQHRLATADADAANWITVGHGASEQRYSQLDQINDKNVQRLGLLWYADLNTFRGVEATPLIIDGVLYNVSAWDITTAYDGVTGKVLWTYDPKIPVSYARVACCGPVSRGLAAWHGKIIVGALDGRLIALDAKTGKEVWTQKLEYSAQSLPISYRGKDGRQYVAVVAAGGAGGKGPDGKPDNNQALIAFALPN